MLLAVLVYNFILVGLNAICLMAIWRHRSWSSGLSAVSILLFCSILFACILGGKVFAVMHLLAYGLLLHLPLVLLVGGIFCWPHRRGLALLALTSSIGLIVIAIDAFLIEPQWLQVTRMTLTGEKVVRPIRLAIVADLQTDKLTKYERSVFRQIQHAQPDMILFAGDYLQLADRDYADLSQQFQEFLNEIGLNAPLGVYAVGGNTDHTNWKQIFDGLPVTTFHETRAIAVGGVQVTGLSINDSFDTNLRISKSDRFHIVVGHSPDFALGDIQADLLVAGHTHGGQVQIPGFGPLVTLSKIPRSWAYGATQLSNDRTLIVSRGIGMERGVAPRLRFFCRPELVIVDLRPQGFEFQVSGSKFQASK